MSKKKTFLKKKRLSGDMPLQITSMADIFMILLVFLLKNYATSVTNLSPTAKMQLPSAAAKGSPREALTVEVGPNVVVIDQQPALRLENFQFPGNDMNESGTSNTISRILLAQRSRKPQSNADSLMVVLADERTPYSTLKRIVASAAGAGYVDLQLVVVNPE